MQVLPVNTVPSMSLLSCTPWLSSPPGDATDGDPRDAQAFIVRGIEPAVEEVDAGGVPEVSGAPLLHRVQNRGHVRAGTQLNQLYQA